MARKLERRNKEDGMDELTQLAIKYGTDKWGKHHYTPVYYEMFKDKRSEIKKVLEIGPAEGAGLFMLRDFFPNATICGAEIDPRRVQKLQGMKRIEVYQVDQSSQDDLDNLIPEIGTDIDIVIDDGSHKPEDQLNTYLYLTSFVDVDTYIIEDVADTSIVKMMSGIPRIIKLSDRYDDVLIICQK